MKKSFFETLYTLSAYFSMVSLVTAEKLAKTLKVEPYVLLMKDAYKIT